MEKGFEYTLFKVLSLFNIETPKTYDQIFDELGKERTDLVYVYANSLFRFLKFLADWGFLIQQNVGYILSQKGLEEREKLRERITTT